ncbi:hypothetical protein G6F36_011270 [Rhizopus arrhizus]|nr:hypothetical protein G6F36_011270 [Rhizopus arrhizus]
MQDLAQVIATAVATAINNKSTNENANVRIPIPSSYNGERSAAIINLWLQEVERYLEFNCVPQQRWLPYAITLLRGRAQKWWNQLSQKNEESQTTSVSEYADAFQDILLDLPRVSDDEALDRFVRGLKNDVRIHVLTKEPRSLEEANRFAIAYDSAKQTGIVLPTRQRDSFADDPMDLSAESLPNMDATSFAIGVTSPDILLLNVEIESEIREFEQTKLKQNRGNFQRQYRQNQNNRQHTSNRIYNADIIEVEPRNDHTAQNTINNLNSFDSVNKDSLLDLSPYPFDFSADHDFLMNASSKNTVLPTYEVFIKGVPYQALIDTGASANYIHPRLLNVVDSYKPVINQAVETANGEQTVISGQAICTMEIKGRSKNFINIVKAFVFESKFDIILGNSWLKQIKPRPDWFDSSWTIMMPDCSTIVMEPYRTTNNLNKQQDEVNVIISAKQLTRLFKTKQVSEYYLVHAEIDESNVNYLNNVNYTDFPWIAEFSKEFPEVFKGHITGLPPMRNTQDIIVTKPDAVPVARPPYKMSPLELSELRKQIDELLAKGLIEPCASEWSNPVLFVRKPNGDLRMCCDYRMLNKVALKQKIQLSRIDECLERLHNAKHFTSLDLTNGFHQQRLTDSDSLKTAISTRYGQFCWKVVPFGLSNSGPAFQKMMNTVLADYIDKFVMVYLDDILVFTNGNEEQHKQHVRMVLRKLDEAKLIINKNKCLFNQKELTFLGYNISEKGILPAPQKIEAIKSWPVPINVQQVRQFMGLAQHYRKFIKGFAGITAPLTDLTKGTGHKRRAIQWTDECQKSFDMIKKKLSSAPVLINPDMDKPFRIECDASDFAVGAVLLQEETKGNSYQVFTDHLPLKYLRSQKQPTPRLVRWLSEVELYDPEILYKPGVENQIPDLLSRRDDVSAIPEKNSMQPRYVYHIGPNNKCLSRLEQDPIQDWPLHYLTTEEKWPDKIKADLIKVRNRFIVKNQQVYKKSKVPKSNEFVELKFIPFAKRADMVDDFHSGYGHAGQASMYNLMKTRVWWPRMQEDINAWISRCSRCQLAAHSDKVSHHAPIKPLEVPHAFSRWHLDFIGELQWVD